ncbi:IS701 family transposase [Aggregicoccus sp. 17bor-14]|uniref:IS701 family transposase n=1 Tax=Myxococcaceae TaxID=31 RepID=UPI00129C3BCF|nr:MULTISPECIES: IS701 family transposase [Myxococcaceae]MBF5046662.1 IS701 family transposase [Simulacricoccus sp. 17bor-14]MRI92371.1 IS701 family transposase [Aggregicoccus sp. 17bor-14]
MARAAAAAPLRALEPADVADIRQRLSDFLQPFAALLVRAEQRAHLRCYVEGRLAPLRRRTVEPIALQAQAKVRPLQHFVGQGAWDDGCLREALACVVGEELGAARGVLVLDSSGFQKCGPASVGVQRQYCGRLGKQDNCQVGEFLAYAARGACVLVDCRLYLPGMWAAHPQVREACGVPDEVQFEEGWRLALGMVLRTGRHLPHRWVVGDDAYGQVCALRDALFEAGERYVLEVPGAKAKVQPVASGRWTHAAAWADGLPQRAWRTFCLRDGEAGPMPVRAARVRVRCRREDGSTRTEVLLVVDSLTSDKRWYYLCTDTRCRLEDLVRVASCRHGVEEALRYAKGEVGLDEYEVRGWTGWHHHMTLCLMALWFLVREKRWLEKKGYALPYRTWRACWPSCLAPHAASRTPPDASAPSSATPTAPERATGTRTGRAPRLRATSPARPHAKGARRTARAHLAQSN